MIHDRPELAAGGAHGSRRRWAGVLLPPAVFLAAVVAALLGGPDGSGVVGTGETVSGSATGALQRAAGAVPLGFAFGAGMVAAVNPCGFALLPGVLGVYLGPAGGRGRLRRALVVSTVVSLSFVLLFGAVGLVLTAVSSALAGAFAWAGLLVGALLLAAAGWVLAGSGPRLDAGQRLANRLGAVARRPGLAGYAAYGLAYGLASLGCALPAFLAVVGSAAAAGGISRAAFQLLLYALGLAVVFTAATVAAALFELGLLRRARGLSRHVPVVSAALLLVSGAYVVYYWLTVGGALSQLLG